MRILQINTNVNSGSTGRIAEEIGKTLVKNDHESYIAYGRGDRPSESKLIKIGTQKDVFKHGVKTILQDKHGLGSIKATKEFIKKLDKIKPDAIGLHNIHGYYINYEILFDYIKSNDIPVLWTFHDCWPFTGHCTYFDSVNCLKWKTHCERCPKSADYPKSFVDRSFKNFDQKRLAFNNVKNLKIITPSKWLADHVRHSFLKNYPIEVIYNGIDLNTFRPLNLKKTEKKIILGVASTWDKRKGLNDFIKLSKLMPDDFQVVLIGLSSKQIKELPENILGIQRTENIEALVEWYNKATVFVNPTYVDNFPTTNIEALACGTPIITYNTGGSPEAVVRGMTGNVISKGDIKALSLSVNRILKNDKVSKMCRSEALKRFSAIDRYGDYLKSYETFGRSQKVK